MQRYPISAVAISRIVIVIVRHHCCYCKCCTVLSSCRCSIQRKVARPSIRIVWSCCLDVCNYFLCSYIRTNITEVWECYHRQRSYLHSNVSALCTVVIVGYIYMVCCCRFWRNCNNICIIWSMQCRIYIIIPYIIVICTDTA